MIICGVLYSHGSYLVMELAGAIIAVAEDAAEDFKRISFKI
nr:hypothetical protein [Sedimentibacter sp.]